MLREMAAGALSLPGLQFFEASPSLLSERARRSDLGAQFTSPFQGL